MRHLGVVLADILRVKRNDIFEDFNCLYTVASFLDDCRQSFVDIVLFELGLHVSQKIAIMFSRLFS